MLVEDRNETVHVARIRELHAEGKSLREVAVVLDAEGHCTKSCGRWHPETLRRVVARL